VERLVCLFCSTLLVKIHPAFKLYYLIQISFLIEHGNTTVYEWRYGEPPLRIEEPPLLIETEEAADSSDGVSFKIN